MIRLLTSVSRKETRLLLTLKLAIAILLLLLLCPFLARLSEERIHFELIASSVIKKNYSVFILKQCAGGNQGLLLHDW